jgi:CDP-diglyceride synthetase
MYQPYPPGGQLGEPERPAAPAPVRTAVKLMYAGAALSTVPLIIVLPSIGDINTYHLRWNGHAETAAQLSHLRPLLITTAIVGGLVVPALWLWMARANGRGRSWARTVSTVLFGLATLALAPPLSGFGEVFGVTVFGSTLAVLTWLVGLVVVWLLWRPASSAFFRPQGFPQAGSGAAISSRIRSSSVRPPRQW